MATLDRASRELFARQPDERCATLAEMATRCQQKKAVSYDRWESPSNVSVAEGDRLKAVVGTDGFWLNDWSFSQLCRHAGVAKDTVNRLRTETARQVFHETLPRAGDKPLQVFVEQDTVRSIHGTAYTRLWDSDVVAVLQEFAVDFEPPQPGCNGATGLYVGEQDMFAFLIDPTGWAEIDGQSFAPGFFVWNSEVGRRSLGIETFWFQAVCQNHIVWDAAEVSGWSRKHTRNVHEGLREIRSRIEQLVEKRDQRKDGFVSVIRKAMAERFEDSDEALKVLGRQGVAKGLARKALELARQNGAFTLWSVVDALTRMAQELPNAGDRLEADQKAASLLALV